MAAKRNSRSRARARVLQAIYQWQMTGQDIADIEAQFLGEQDMKGVDLDMFQHLLHEIPAHLRELDELLAPYLDRSIDKVDPVERAVLRLGVCELARHIEVPYRVVINEAVELAREYGAEQGHRYINGVLDRAAQQLRPVEVKAGRR